MTTTQKFFVAQGSIYNPGWSVIEQVEPALQRVRATFDEKTDAEEFLAALLADVEEVES